MVTVTLTGKKEETMQRRTSQKIIQETKEKYPQMEGESIQLYLTRVGSKLHEHPYYQNKYKTGKARKTDDKI